MAGSSPAMTGEVRADARVHKRSWETANEETDLPGGFSREPRDACGGAGREAAAAQIHPAVRSPGARSGLDHRLRHAEPRLHGVRHAVRAKRLEGRLQSR